jgi:hypothetical protein
MYHKKTGSDPINRLEKTQLAMLAKQETKKRIGKFNLQTKIKINTSEANQLNPNAQIATYTNSLKKLLLAYSSSLSLQDTPKKI